MTDKNEQPGAVERVFALVELQDRVVQEIRDRGATDGPDAPGRVLVVNQPGDDRLNVFVSLSAQTTDGRRISRGQHDFGMGGGRHGIDGVWHRYHGPRPDGADEEALHDYIDRHHHVGPADLEDGVNQMLGRDPELHHHPDSTGAD
jgi:hypothetical protein